MKVKLLKKWKWACLTETGHKFFTHKPLYHLPYHTYFVSNLIKHEFMFLHDIETPIKLERGCLYRIEGDKLILKEKH